MNRLPCYRSNLPTPRAEGRRCTARSPRQTALSCSRILLLCRRSCPTTTWPWLRIARHVKSTATRSRGEIGTGGIPHRNLGYQSNQRLPSGFPNLPPIQRVCRPRTAEYRSHSGQLANGPWADASPTLPLPFISHFLRISSTDQDHPIDRPQG